MRRSVVISILVVVGLVAFAAVAGFWVILGPNTQAYDGERGVKIAPGADLASAVDSLRSAGVLRSDDTFSLFARATGWGDQIKAGYYVFESGESNLDMVQKLRRGLQEPVRLTIPPGTRPEVIAMVAGREMFFEPAEFLDALKDPAIADSLETDTSSLFAFMLPETYHFYWLTSAPRTVINIKRQFDAFWERELKAGADSLGLSKHDVVTLAGIVEWETGLSDEKAAVAGVYANRLRIGMKLDADPTVQFAVMESEGVKRRLLYEDYSIDHPYNTYIHGGLPPGPITNPSPSSLRAAVNPEEHDYLFFVARGDGSHVFSRTLTEHNRAAREYQELMRSRRAEQNSAGGN